MDFTILAVTLIVIGVLYIIFIVGKYNGKLINLKK